MASRVSVKYGNCCLQVVWSCSTRSLLLWCAHSGAFLGALLRERDTGALFSDLEMPPSTAVPPAVAEREERKHFVDPGKVRSQELSISAGACCLISATCKSLKLVLLAAAREAMLGGHGVAISPCMFAVWNLWAANNSVQGSQSRK